MKYLRRLLLALFAFILLMIILLFSQTATKIAIPKDGSPALLFATDTNHDLQHSYVAAINQAKNSILIAVYSITDKEIIAALRKKSEDGVSVTIISHADISHDIENRVGNKVKVIKRFGKGLMHLKIMVVDKQISYIGSANLTGASLKMYGNLVMAFDSPALSEFLTEKIMSLEAYSTAKRFSHRDFIIGGQLVEVWFLPDDSQASIRIKQLIREAQKTIKVAMFTWTREDFAKEIASASSKGVDVQVILDRSSSQGASLGVFDLLNKSSISLKLNKGVELLHHKFLYIDGKTLVNGSANWTKNAFNTNDDCFFVIHDLNDEQRNEMENIWQAINLTSSKPDPR